MANRANPLASPAALNTGLFIGRAIFGAYWLLAGWSKVSQVGVDKFVSSNLADATRFLPEVLARVYLTALPYAEIVVGAMLILGLFTRIAAIVSALMLLSIVMAKGVSGGSGPFNHALVMLGFSVLLVGTGAGAIAVDHLIARGRTASRG